VVVSAFTKKYLRKRKKRKRKKRKRKRNWAKSRRGGERVRGKGA
jgi:hypothetical protein